MRVNYPASETHILLRLAHNPVKDEMQREFVVSLPSQSAIIRRRMETAGKLKLFLTAQTNEDHMEVLATIMEHLNNTKIKSEPTRRHKERSGPWGGRARDPAPRAPCTTQELHSRV